MTRQFWVLAAVGSVALAGCATDPTSSLNGTPASIETSLSSFSVNVGDSVRVTAQLKDAQGVTLPTLPTVSSSDANVVAVDTTAGVPLSQRAFYVRGTGYGQTTVMLTSGSITDSIVVQTYPASVVITGASDLDTLGSGNTLQLAPSPLSSTGASIVVNDQFEWSSDASTIASVDSTGLVTAKAPGSVTITVTAPGGAEGTVDLVVEPGAFAGTLSANNGSPDGNAMFTATSGAGDQAFDANTITTIGGVRAWTEVVSPTEMNVIIPATGTAAAQDLLFTGLGTDQTARLTTFTTNAAYGDGHLGSDNEFTAPLVSAARAPSGYIYFAHSGHGSGGAARGIWNGGAQVDHYFQFTTGPGGATVSGVVEWFDGSDVDVAICLQADTGDCPGGFFSGSDDDEVIGSTTLAANTTYVIIVSMWDGGSDRTNMRMTLNGI